MNNIRQKNVIQQFTNNSEMPYGDFEYVDHAAVNYTIDSTDINHCMQTLLDNDLYIEQSLNSASAYMIGPKSYDESELTYKPNGYKIWGDVATADCLDVRQKIETDLKDTTHKSANFGSSKITFVKAFDNAVFVGSKNGPVKYSTDVEHDEWHTLDVSITANGCYADNTRMLFAAEDGVYELSTYMNIDTSDETKYGKKEYSAVRLNKNALNHVTAVGYNKHRSMVTAATISSKNKGQVYEAPYYASSLLADRQQALTFTECYMFNDKSRTTPYVNDVNVAPNKKTVLASTEGLLTSAMRWQFTDLIVSNPQNNGDEIFKIGCAIDEFLFFGSNKGLYRLNPNTEQLDKILSNYDIQYMFGDKNIVFVSCIDKNGFLPTTKLVAIKPDGTLISGDVLSMAFRNDAGHRLFTYGVFPKKNIALLASTNDGLKFWKISYLIQGSLTLFCITQLDTPPALAGGIVDMCKIGRNIVFATTSRIYTFSTNVWKRNDSNLIKTFDQWGYGSRVYTGNVKKIVKKTNRTQYFVSDGVIEQIGKPTRRISLPPITDVVYATIGEYEYLVATCGQQMNFVRINFNSLTLENTLVADSNLGNIIVDQHTIISRTADKLYWVSRERPIAKESRLMYSSINTYTSQLASDTVTGYALSGSSINNTGNDIYEIKSYRTLNKSEVLAGYSVQELTIDPFTNVYLMIGTPPSSDSQGVYALSVFENEYGNISSAYKKINNAKKGTKQICIITTSFGNRQIATIDDVNDGKGFGVRYASVAMKNMPNYSTNLNLWSSLVMKDLTTEFNPTSICHGQFNESECIYVTGHNGDLSNQTLYKITPSMTNRNVVSLPNGIRSVARIEFYLNDVDDDKFSTFVYIQTKTGKAVVKDNQNKSLITTFNQLSSGLRATYASRLATYFIKESDGKVYAYHYDDVVGDTTPGRQAYLDEILCDGSSLTGIQEIASYDIQTQDPPPDGEFSLWSDVTFFIGKRTVYLKNWDNCIVSSENDPEFNATAVKSFETSYDIQNANIQKIKNPLMLVATTNALYFNKLVDDGSATNGEFTVPCNTSFTALSSRLYSINIDDLPASNGCLIENAYFVMDDKIDVLFNDQRIIRYGINYNNSAITIDSSNFSIYYISTVAVDARALIQCQCDLAYFTYMARPDSKNNAYSRLINVLDYSTFDKTITTSQSGQDNEFYQLYGEYTTNSNNDHVVQMHLLTKAVTENMIIDDTTPMCLPLHNIELDIQYTSAASHYLFVIDANNDLYVISDIEIDTYKIKKIASNILTVYAYMAVYGYVDVYVVDSNNDIYMHRYSTSLDATDFSAIANVDLICQSHKDGDENKVPINQILQLEANLHSNQIFGITNTEYPIFSNSDSTGVYIYNGKYDVVLSDKPANENKGKLITYVPFYGACYVTTTTSEDTTTSNLRLISTNFDIISTTVGEITQVFASDTLILCKIASGATTHWYYTANYGIIDDEKPRPMRLVPLDIINHGLAFTCLGYFNGINVFGTTSGAKNPSYMDIYDISMSNMHSILQSHVQSLNADETCGKVGTIIKNKHTTLKWYSPKNNTLEDSTFKIKIDFIGDTQARTWNDSPILSTWSTEYDVNLTNASFAGKMADNAFYCEIDQSLSSTILHDLESYKGKQFNDYVSCSISSMEFCHYCWPEVGENMLKHYANVYYSEMSNSYVSTRRTQIVDANGISSFTGYDYRAAFDTELGTKNINCFSMTKDNDCLWIATDDSILKYDYNLYAIRKMPTNRICLAYYDSPTTYRAISDGRMLSSKNGKIWKTMFNLSSMSPSKISSVNDMENIDVHTYLYGTDSGLFYSKYDYVLEQDVKAFTHESALALYDQVLTAPNGICSQLCTTLSDHLSTEHLSSAVISKLNAKYLDVDMQDIENWQTATVDDNSMVVRNDIIQEMFFGSFLDGDVVASCNNYLNDKSNSAFEISGLNYIMKRWMSGLTELYIHLPTTYTYYLPNQWGAGNCKSNSETTYTRKNLADYGEDKMEQGSAMSSHYTTIQIGITSSEYHIDALHEIQINGNSLPLAIYQDNSNNSQLTANTLYKSFVEPSVVKTYDITKTNEDGYYIFNFGCFGTDSQSIKLVFYDNSAKSNQPWIKINFDPNGGSGVMAKQKFILKEDGTLECKTLKKNKFVNTDGTTTKIFNGWTITPYPDDYIWNGTSYDGTQQYKDGTTFPHGDTLSALEQELGRDFAIDPLYRKEEITLYASWISYEFTTADTTFIMNSNKTQFYIADVGIDESTKLKDAVVIAFGE